MSDTEYNRIVNQYADTIYRVALSYSEYGNLEDWKAGEDFHIQITEK